MRNIEKYKSKIFFFLFVFLLLGYFFLIWKNFLASLNNISSIFGYVDYQHNWRGLEEFLSFRIPFKDYFYEYGWFFLAMQSLGYFIFGRNFLAILISMFLYMPVLGMILTYFIARNVLKKKFLVLVFLFFLLLFGTNYNYNSAKHLVAELSLSFFILYLFKDKVKHLFLAGIIGGLAILTALEYGIALNIAIFLIFLLSFFSKTKLKKHFLSKFFLGQLLVLFLYFFWLYIKGALSNYWKFTSGFINNFYYASPCSGDSFPRLSEIKTLAPISKLLIFNLPVEFLQRINFYLVFGFFIIAGLISFIFFVKDRKFSKNSLANLGLIFYGLLIFVRTLDTPCVGYFVYGLVPFFLLVTLLIEEIVLWSRQKKALMFKVIGIFGIIAIFSWFMLTENTGYVTKFFGKKEKEIKKQTYREVFYSPVGWDIRKDFAEAYQEIADYIKENSTKDDFLYSYPLGPYNNLTGRKRPNSLNIFQASIAGKQFMEMTERELETKRPKFIVINIYNNLGVAHYGKSRGDVARYFSLGYEDGPVFNGEGNVVEKYILENYETALKNDLAIVMKQRTKPITIETKKKKIYAWQPGRGEKMELQSMEKGENSNNYKITGEKASWALVFDEPIEASDITVEFKLDGDLWTKHLSRYFVNLHILNKGGKKLGETRVLARKAWQTEKIYFNQPKEVKMLKIEIGDNTGLIWWLNPYNLEIKKVTFYE